MRDPAMVADEALAQGPADVLVGRSPAMQEVYKRSAWWRRRISPC